MDSPYVKRYVSSDEQYVAVTSANEIRMSQWIENLTILALKDQRQLFVPHHLWSAEHVQWSDDSQHLLLDMRRYPGDVPSVAIDINVRYEIAKVSTPFETEKIPLAQLSTWLEAYYQRHGKHE